MIRSKAAGVFMWVVLVVDILNRELRHGGTITGAKRRLEKLPSKLGDLFKDILLRDGTDKDGLLLCLGWILYAQYPLASAELYYALQVGLNPNEEETLAERDLNITTDESMQLFILHKSKGLAEITASDAVQFIHESVRDFLIKDNGIKYLWPAGAEDFEYSSHDRLKDGCLFYLKVCRPLLGLVQKVQKVNTAYPLREDSILRNWHVNTGVRHALLHFPFLYYAATALFYHANIAGRTKSQADFLQSVDFKRWLTMKNFCIQKFANIQSDSCARGAALIQIIRDGDHKELIDCLFNSGLPIAFPPSQLHEPFLAAIKTGDFELARRLAARVDVNLQDAEGRTLLSIASQDGLEDLTLFLLKDLHADVNIMDNEGKTALFYASKCHYNIVRHIVAVESFDVHAISSSVQPREDISWGNIDSVDASFASSPLWGAVRGRQHAIAEFLLRFQIAKAGLDVDLAGALFHLALTSNDKAVLPMLFDILGSKTTDVFHAYGQNLQVPSINAGSTKVVDQLLRTRGLDWNLHDRQGNAPLTVAARCGQENIVRRLLAIDKIDVNCALTGSKGKTPMFEAIFHAHDSITQQLLRAPGIDINVPSSEGQTPLFCAVLTGNASLVKQLLRVPGVDVNFAETIKGETPLMRATRRGDYSIVAHLVSANRIDPNNQDIEGNTALILAAKSASYAITGLLLSAEGINVSLQNRRGVTALAEAVWARRHLIVGLLLRSARNIDVNVVDRDGCTPLMLAALRRGRWEFEALLATEGIDVNAQDKRGRTALSICMLKNDVLMMELLLARDDVDLELADQDGNTPLSLMENLKHSAHILQMALHKKAKTLRPTSAVGDRTTYPSSDVHSC